MQRQIEFICKMDKNGRVVLPKEICDMYGLMGGEDVYVIAMQEGILIQKA